MLGFLTFFTNLPISAGDKPILVDPQDVLDAANWLVLDQALDVAPCNENSFFRGKRMMMMMMMKIDEARLCWI